MQVRQSRLFTKAFISSKSLNKVLVEESSTFILSIVLVLEL